jgi:hypothetical protein
MDWRLSSSHYFRQQLLDYFHLTRITKVTFTLPGGRATIRLWFGSSGGGLPRRPELKSLGRFFMPAVRQDRLAGKLRSQPQAMRLLRPLCIQWSVKIYWPIEGWAFILFRAVRRGVARGGIDGG